MKYDIYLFFFPTNEVALLNSFVVLLCFISLILQEVKKSQDKLGDLIPKFNEEMMIFK